MGTSQTYRLLTSFALIFCHNTFFEASLGRASDLEDTHWAKCYLEAYPNHIVAFQDGCLVWEDGTHMPLKNKNAEQPTSFQEALDQPDLCGQVSTPYPLGPDYLSSMKETEYEPGRIRYDLFFKKMYGATADEVKCNLREVPWMPGTFGESARKLLFTQINGIADKIRRISDELDVLCAAHPEFKKYLEGVGGSFNWRVIAGTTRQSAHSWGMTIDINVATSNYWLWDFKSEHSIPKDQNVMEKDVRTDQLPEYRNRIPYEIIEIFEKYDFIWGGKWRHYDTMHFEYRPEIPRLKN
jgi:peptidoglycan LD-endopeptidase CwlK